MISVIVPTCNAVSRIGDLLQAVCGQTAPPQEILIADSESTDDTVQVAETFGASVLSVRKAAFDHGRTRSLAARKANGDLLIFLTQDAIPANVNCFAALLTSFGADDVAAAYGRQLPAEKATPFARHLRSFNYPEQSCIRQYRDKQKLGLKTAFLSNSFAAYRKADLEAVGYFEPGLIFGEDMHTAAKLLRAGKQIAYNADAKVIHSHDYSLRDEFRRYFDMGVFHQEQSHLLAEFGSAQKEGLRYIRSELKFLIGQNQFYLLPLSVLRSAAKYTGYRCGRWHRLFPHWWNRRAGLNHSWWDRNA